MRSAAKEDKEEKLPTTMGTALELVDLGEDAGAGLEDMKMEEQLTPFLRILQSGSPQVNDREPVYVEGARAGMLYDTATQECFDGKDGVQLIVAARDYHYGAWRPRDSGGGFRGMFAPDDPIVRKLLGEYGKFKKLPYVINGEDVELAETFQFYILYAPEDLNEATARRAILSFSSTAIPVAQGLLTRHNNWRYPIEATRPDGSKQVVMKPAQLWSYKWRLTTVSQSNASGNWFNYRLNLEPSGAKPRDALIPRTDPLFELGREFYNLYKSGQVKPDYETSGEAGATGEGNIPF